MTSQSRSDEEDEKSAEAEEARRRSLTISKSDRRRSSITSHADRKMMRRASTTLFTEIENERRNKYESELARATAEAAAATAAVLEEVAAITDGESENEGDLEDEAPRPTSPIIIWRPNLRVKIATEIPSELIQMSALDLDVNDMDNRMAICAMSRPFDGSKSQAVDDEMSSQVSLRKGLSNSSFASTKPSLKTQKKEKKSKYGAWYIPPRLWGDVQKGGDEVFKKIVDRGQEVKKPDMQSKIADLYSSKIYKEYIIKAGLRVPHYLENVHIDSGSHSGESPPKGGK